MNMHFICRLFPASASALLMTVSAFGQAANAPAQPPEFSKSQLLTDQRVMRANIADANFHIDRGIKAVAANLPDSAKVSILRATSRIAQVDEVMKSHPAHIEQLAFNLFYSRETVRKELRESYHKLREDFGAVEDAMYALRRDMLRKGLFGEELKGQVAVLDAASKLLPEIQQKDPALAQKVRGLVDDINKALANGDTATADRLIQQLSSALASGGYQQNIDDAKQKIEASAAGPEGAGAGAAAAQAQALAGGGSLEPTAGGLKVTGRDGQAATIPGATPAGGGKARLADGTEVDLNGSQVLPDGSIRLADGRVIKDGRIAGPAAPQGPVTPPRNATLVDADGNEVAEEYVWENGEGKGVDKVYVGGKGKRLTRETKVTVRATPSAGKANTYEVTKTAGESRSWAFVVAPVPGSEKKAAGSLTIALALTDRNGGAGYTVSKWDITSPAGAPSVSATSGTQATATFSASATYSITVSGTTDWGSSFAITTSLPVGVE